MAMTKAQQNAIDTIRANGGSIVRFNFGWDKGIKLHFKTVSSLVKLGFLMSIALPPRGGSQFVPVKYSLVYA
jgi:hypothetical protein